MYKERLFTTASAIIVLAWVASSCGGASTPPKSSGEEADGEYLSDIVGDVEESEIQEAHTDQKVEQAYSGPTELTVELKVVNELNPEGSFKVIDADGNTVKESGALGEPFELAQGTYSIEYTSPLVFGKSTYLVEDVQVAGENDSGPLRLRTQ